VKYHPENLTGLSIFHPTNNLDDKYVLNNDRPCLVMYKESQNQLDLAIVDPDLAFYDGADETPKNPDGTRKEVSIYSRYWFKTPAQSTVLKVTLRGEWEALTPDADAYSLEKTKEGNTLLHVYSKYGLTTNISLTKK